MGSLHSKVASHPSSTLHCPSSGRSVLSRGGGGGGCCCCCCPFTEASPAQETAAWFVRTNTSINGQQLTACVTAVRSDMEANKHSQTLTTAWMVSSMRYGMTEEYSGRPFAQG